MKSPLHHLDHIVGSSLRWFCIFSFLALMGVLSGVVFIRFWPIAKLSWSDEVIELLMAWIVLSALPRCGGRTPTSASRPSCASLKG